MEGRMRGLIVTAAAGLTVRTLLEQIPRSLRLALESRFGDGSLAAMPLLGWLGALAGFVAMPRVAVAAVPVLCAVVGGLVVWLAFASYAWMAIAIVVAVQTLSFFTELACARVYDTERDRSARARVSRAIVMRDAAFSAVAGLVFAIAMRALGLDGALVVLGAVTLGLALPMWRLARLLGERRPVERDDIGALLRALRDPELLFVQLANVLATKQVVGVAYYIGPAGWIVGFGEIEPSLPPLLRGVEAASGIYLVAESVLQFAVVSGPVKRRLDVLFDAERSPRRAAYGPDVAVAAAVMAFGAVPVAPGWTVVPLALVAIALLQAGRLENNAATRARVSRPDRGDATSRQAVDGIGRLLSALPAVLVPMLLGKRDPELPLKLSAIALAAAVLLAVVAVPLRRALQSRRVAGVAEGEPTRLAVLDGGRHVIFSVGKELWNASPDAIRNRLREVLGGEPVTHAILAVAHERAAPGAGGRALAVDLSLLAGIGEGAAVGRSGGAWCAVVTLPAGSWEEAVERGRACVRDAAADVPGLGLVAAGRPITL